MQRYANRSGSSGVRAFELGPGWILVEFTEGSVYRYDAQTPGAPVVAEMQRLARAGEGLSTYISRQVQGRFARKLR